MHIVHLKATDLPNLKEIPARPPEQGILLVKPTYYDVVYEINPHMKGNIGNVDTVKAMKQWNALHDIYEELGYEIHVLEGVKDLPDMVFCANQSFPFLDQKGEHAVLLSWMASIYRSDEVKHVEEWYKSHGYRVIHQTAPYVKFEGMGDAIWHPGKRLAYIGYGFRTSKNALQRISDGIDFEVVGLELIRPHFYHLDTAFSAINEHTALYVEEAFSDEGIAILKLMFPHLIKVPLEEAKYGFVTNGHCPDGKNFIVHKGNDYTKTELEKIGLKVWEVDTSEFIKAGGSVFCMKMMLP